MTDKQHKRMVRVVNGYREDLAWVAGNLQNHPDRFARVIASDPDTRKEFGRLVGDLFSLVEVIMTEATLEEPK
jgi:hypothetical protein